MQSPHFHTQFHQMFLLLKYNFWEFLLALVDVLRFLWDPLKAQILETSFVTVDKTSEVRLSDLSSPKLLEDVMH